MILILGGLFLLWKSTHEIHEKLEGEDGQVSGRVAPKFASVVFQILLLDIVFSLDSVITAVGMANNLWVMIAAVIIAVVFMLVYADRLSDFIHRHPSLKMLALSFLMLIGVAFASSVRPVPVVTTSRLYPESSFAAAGDRKRTAGSLTAAAEFAIHLTGSTRPPAATAAATRAIVSGETSTSACPYPAYGRLRRSAAGVSGRAVSIWKNDAASRIGRGPRRSASCAK